MPKLSWNKKREIDVCNDSSCRVEFRKMAKEWHPDRWQAKLVALTIQDPIAAEWVRKTIKQVFEELQKKRVE